ncbi:unnamed protein product [Thelazia callipaeda]|uniref:Chitin-binding type-2 domain-containing protein n=1 Tax=Thelazia callipaeda TaxID=103827 RepID=A0A0N5CXZ5_THECL|nr:unnamed protein product [Thelazia callipaeda]
MRVPGHCWTSDGYNHSKSWQFDCKGGPPQRRCIPLRRFHDGIVDCPDGICFPGYIKCGSYCVSPKYTTQCFINPKEKLCPVDETLPCKGYGECVMRRWIEQGQTNCIDKSDEDIAYIAIFGIKRSAISYTNFQTSTAPAERIRFIGGTLGFVPYVTPSTTPYSTTNELNDLTAETTPTQFTFQIPTRALNDKNIDTSFGHLDATESDIFRNELQINNVSNQSKHQTINENRNIGSNHGSYLNINLLNSRAESNSENVANLNFYKTENDSNQFNFGEMKTQQKIVAMSQKPSLLPNFTDNSNEEAAEKQANFIPSNSANSYAWLSTELNGTKNKSLASVEKLPFIPRTSFHNFTAFNGSNKGSVALQHGNFHNALENEKEAINNDGKNKFWNNNSNDSGNKSNHSGNKQNNGTFSSLLNTSTEHVRILEQNNINMASNGQFIDHNALNLSTKMVQNQNAEKLAESKQLQWEHNGIMLIFISCKQYNKLIT